MTRVMINSVLIFLACDYKWMVENNQGQLEAEVEIQLQLERQIANVSVRAYSFDPNSQWLGIGISYDQFMVCVVCIIVFPFNVWTP